MDENIANELLKKTMERNVPADKNNHKSDLTKMSAINLAYIGDAVFEVLVRTKILTEHKMSANELHKSAKTFVRAKAQSDMYYKIQDILSPEELAVMKRGRNAKSHSKAKNASVADYRHATGLEALFGYLYLHGSIDRIMELFSICVLTDN